MRLYLAVILQCLQIILVSSIFCLVARTLILISRLLAFVEGRM